MLIWASCIQSKKRPRYVTINYYKQDNHDFPIAASELMTFSTQLVSKNTNHSEINVLCTVFSTNSWHESRKGFKKYTVTPIIGAILILKAKKLVHIMKKGPVLK